MQQYENKVERLSLAKFFYLLWVGKATNIITEWNVLRTSPLVGSGID
jgi:hypothetical protein